MAEIVLITGLSGAGRSSASDVLEDLGWNVIDNLPTNLVSRVVELVLAPGSAIERLAVVAGRQHGQVLDELSAIREAGHHVTLIVLDARTSAVVKRYDATRRRHPLADEAGGVIEAIELERSRLEPVREAADMVIDTSDINIHELRERLNAAFDSEEDPHELQLSVESFGFKHGLPLDADIVMDVRFLPNPHWVDELRPQTGYDAAVRSFVLDRPETSDFLRRFEELLLSLLPTYRAEGRTYLTVAVGCTGGRHRSVAIVEEFVSRLHHRGVGVRVTHRDIQR
ncbi:MAG: RNase adapter RapZ [Actinomycetota bacterium]|nr:RNase adapter RapZ [Actinomycetota bacterium]MDQ3311681.1 RNase adapter RapZ [Actinomycetota bacterium]MDQ3352140.1 RNase adapter RapZ [Actinomycetota bacterium]